MRTHVAWSFAFLFACVAGCGSVSVNSDGGAGSGGTHATGSAGAGSSGAAGTGSAGASGGAGTGAAGSGAAGAAGSGAAGTGAAGSGAAGTGAAGTGSGGGGAAGHGAAGSGGRGGAGGATGNEPCVDKTCSGACEGTSCTGAWTCDTMVACSALATQYCGCDGKTFTSGSCASRAYAFRGTCEAGVSCDTTKVLCKIVAPMCPTGQVPSVSGSCYGPCVPVAACACTAPADCPNPDTTTCHMNTKRCGPFVN